MWLRVESIRRAAAGVVVLELADADGRELPDWEPGSHLELTLPSGLVRHYSLCGPASGRDSYQVAVLRVPDGRGGSREIHDTGLVGRSLLVRGPHNRFPLVDASHYLLLAGGIGITPLLPIARALARQMSPFRLIYGARSGDGVFELVLKQSGRNLIVPADRTALEVVREAIPGHPYSCLAGECGSCEVRVLEGLVDHRDEVLSDSERAENSAMMLCVSRAVSSRLVVDL